MLGEGIKIPFGVEHGMEHDLRAMKHRLGTAARDCMLGSKDWSLFTLPLRLVGVLRDDVEVASKVGELLW